MPQLAEDSSALRHDLALPIELWHLVMDALYNVSSPEDHCYRNQRIYCNWALVCHAWRIYAQRLLFRTVELTDPVCLRRFAALLDFAPHIAPYVRSLRIYSRHLFTPNNVFAQLPDTINSKLPNLRYLAVTRIQEIDSWHPLSSIPPTADQLSHMPLPQDFPRKLGSLHHVTALKLYFMSFRSFTDLAQTVHAFPNLRVLAVIEVHWRYDDFPAFMSADAMVTPREHQPSLPRIEDLTVIYFFTPRTLSLLTVCILSSYHTSISMVQNASCLRSHPPAPSRISTLTVRPSSPCPHLPLSSTRLRGGVLAFRSPHSRPFARSGCRFLTRSRPTRP